MCMYLFRVLSLMEFRLCTILKFGFLNNLWTKGDRFDPFKIVLNTVDKIYHMKKQNENKKLLYRAYYK